MEKTQLNTDVLINQAVEGDKEAMEILLKEVQTMVFNLSLRMLGTIQDAEDASQEIFIKVITHLSSFRKESNYSTWVFRIAVNHLKTYRKNMFSKFPLSFEFYGEDIAAKKEKDIPDLTQNVEKRLLEEELKLSCTNAMLQCLDKESRCIFILGTMFKIDSVIAGEILDITPEAYRKRLSRIRKKMADFMTTYCGHSGGMCSCEKRINYAVASHRLDPRKLEYSCLKEGKSPLIEKCKNAMEKMDELSLVFSSFPVYETVKGLDDFLLKILKSDDYRTIVNA